MFWPSRLNPSLFEWRLLRLCCSSFHPPIDTEQLVVQQCLCSHPQHRFVTEVCMGRSHSDFLVSLQTSNTINNIDLQYSFVMYLRPGPTPNKDNIMHVKDCIMYFFSPCLVPFPTTSTFTSSSSSSCTLVLKSSSPLALSV